MLLRQSPEKWAMVTYTQVRLIQLVSRDSTAAAGGHYQQQLLQIVHIKCFATNCPHLNVLLQIVHI